MPFLKTQADRDRAERVFYDMKNGTAYHWEPNKSIDTVKVGWAILAGLVMGASAMGAIILFLPELL